MTRLPEGSDTVFLERGYPSWESCHCRPHPKVDLLVGSSRSMSAVQENRGNDAEKATVRGTSQEKACYTGGYRFVVPSIAE